MKKVDMKRCRCNHTKHENNKVVPRIERDPNGPYKITARCKVCGAKFPYEKMWSDEFAKHMDAINSVIHQDKYISAIFGLDFEKELSDLQLSLMKFNELHKTISMRAEKNSEKKRREEMYEEDPHTHAGVWRIVCKKGFRFDENDT